MKVSRYFCCLLISKFIVMIALNKLSFVIEIYFLILSERVTNIPFTRLITLPVMFNPFTFLWIKL